MKADLDSLTATVEVLGRRMNDPDLPEASREHLRPRLDVLRKANRAASYAASAAYMARAHGHSDMQVAADGLWAWARANAAAAVRIANSADCWRCAA